MNICPVCNGMSYINHVYCKNCGNLCYDEGPIINYLGPYSPYEDSEFMREEGDNTNEEDVKCLHIISCPICGENQRQEVELLRL